MDQLWIRIDLIHLSITCTERPEHFQNTILKQNTGKISSISKLTLRLFNGEVKVGGGKELNSYRFQATLCIDRY